MEINFHHQFSSNVEDLPFIIIFFMHLNLKLIRDNVLGDNGVFSFGNLKCMFFIGYWGKVLYFVERELHNKSEIIHNYCNMIPQRDGLFVNVRGGLLQKWCHITLLFDK